MGQVGQLAATIAEFHARSPVASGAFGTPAATLAPARQNFEQMLPLAGTPNDRAALRTLQQWTEREHASCRAAFEARRSGGL